MRINDFTAMIPLVDMGRPVEVYRNLHKQCWSVRQGTVKFHSDHLYLRDAQFKVSAAGRERVLREKRKNVHAVVKGFVAAPVGGEWIDVTYNPYLYSTFVSAEQPIYFADYVEFRAGCRAFRAVE